MAMGEGGVDRPRRFAINAEVEDALIRLENQMYGFGGVAGRTASGDRYLVEEYIREIGQENIALLAARGRS